MAEEKKRDWQKGRERFEHDKRQQYLHDRRVGHNRMTDKQIEKRVKDETRVAHDTAIRKHGG